MDMNIVPWVHGWTSGARHGGLGLRRLHSTIAHGRNTVSGLRGVLRQQEICLESNGFSQHYSL
jgi:hypothetical protein